MANLFHGLNGDGVGSMASTAVTLNDTNRQGPSPLDNQQHMANAESDRANPFVCNVCKRNYSRVDHLARHYRSHTSEKPFSCSTCGKSFARADLLKRHAASHTSEKSSKKKQRLSSPSARLSRVSQACAACAAAKLRCGEEKPCRRCQRKGIECTFPQPHEKQTSDAQSARTLSNYVKVQDPTVAPFAENLSNMYNIDHQQNQNVSMHMGSVAFSPTVDPMHISRQSENEQALTVPSTSLGDDHLLDLDDSSLADFLRDVMMAPSPNVLMDQNNMDFMQHPYASRDVFNFGIDSSLDFDDLDMGWINSFNDKVPLLNFAFQPEQAETHLDRGQQTGLQTGQQTPDVRNSINLGAEAFQKSIWRWAPGNQEHGYTENVNLSLPSQDMEKMEMRLGVDILPQKLELSSRDEILVKSFPSCELMDNLIHQFFRSELSNTDAWIHIPTFSPQSQIPLLNGTVAAAGALLSSVPTVRKLGFAIQEAVRLAIPKYMEADNSTTRDLQPLQSYALQLLVGRWSGNKRKMEIAESHALPLVTMMRRAGRFRRTRNPPVAPEMEDDEKTLDLKWRAWVEDESFKRLAFHMLIQDAQTAMSLLVRPLISYAEVSLELPCSSALWYAKNAYVWRDIYLQKYPAPAVRLPSLMHCVHDIERLEKLQDTVDVQMSTSIILHSIWSLICEYRQLEGILKLQPPERHWNGGLISTSLHQELCQMLDHFGLTISNWYGGTRPEIILLQELFKMNLHVSFDELQLFAGKEGSEEAHRVYPLLQQWFENRKARQAVWHAGQVIRAAKSFAPNTLRDIYAVALYHASLALWVYGMISLGSRRSKRKAAPAAFVADEGSEFIQLDGIETAELRRFVAVQRGVPVIQELGRRPDDAAGWARLEKPKKVMEVVIGVLSWNWSSGNGALPPLVENLGQLMRDLGSAARIVGSH